MEVWAGLVHKNRAADDFNGPRQSINLFLIFLKREEGNWAAGN